MSSVHPAIDPQLYSPPALERVLKDIGAEWASTGDIFPATDRNLQEVKEYLSDPAVWERDIEAAVVTMADKYRRWMDGPAITRELAHSLAERHPWLTTGEAPKPATFGAAPPHL